MTRMRFRGFRLPAVVALLGSLSLGLLVGPVQVAAQADQDDTGVDGNSYVSPAFGYSFEWDRTWEVTDETVESDFNMLQLEDRNSILWIVGSTPVVDTAECVENDIASLENQDGVSDVEATDPEETADGGAESELNFVLTIEDEETGEDVASDWLGYVKCLEINDGEANLLISHYGLADGWDDSAEGREEVLDTLETDGAPDDGDEPGETDDPGETDADDEDEPVDTSDTDSLLTEVQGDGDVPSNIDDIIVLFQASIADIMLYWERQFPLVSGGADFVPPSFVPYVGSLDTACGPIVGWDPDLGSGDGPLQCGGDTTIYLDVNFVEFQYEQVGGEVPFLVTAVVAHEVAHHVQDLLGMVACYQTPCLDPNQLTGLEIEYMADCFAGTWAADAQLRGRLGARDVDLAIVQWATTLGGGTESADWGSHGTGSERTWWFLNGLIEGANVCFETSDVTRNWLADSGGGEDETPEATDEPTTDETETPEETPENGNAGGATELGDALEISLGTLTATETLVETSIDNRDADGQFVIVFVEVELTEDGPFDYSGWTVIDGDGEIYELDERATDLYLTSGYDDGMDQEFEAGGWGIAFVFDLPEDAEGLTLVNEAEGVSIALDI